MPGFLVLRPEEGWHSAQELSRALVMIGNNETTLGPGFFTSCLYNLPFPSPAWTFQESISARQTSVLLLVYMHTDTHITRVHRNIHVHSQTYIHMHTQTCIHIHTQTCIHK